MKEEPESRPQPTERGCELHSEVAEKFMGSETKLVEILSMILHKIMHCPLLHPLHLNTSILGLQKKKEVMQETVMGKKNKQMEFSFMG